jgi:hypothetical protein
VDKDDEHPMASARKLPPLHIVGPDDAATAPAATPQDEFPTHEAITKKMLNPFVEGAELQTPPPIAPSGTKSAKLAIRVDTKRLTLIGGAVFGLVVGTAGMWKVLSRPSPAAPTPAVAATPAQPPSPAAPPPNPAPAATCHLDISVQPAEATLVLDGTTAGGNRIRGERPKDQKRHLVEAWAPGYEPFKKTVSFTTDVYLDIELRRQPGPAKSPTRARAPQSVPKPKGEARGAQDPVEDFGMNLERPAPRRPAKKIDEKDPYSP